MPVFYRLLRLATLPWQLCGQSTRMLGARSLPIHQGQGSESEIEPILFGHDGQQTYDMRSTASENEGE